MKPATIKKLRPKVCKVCKDMFLPVKPMQAVCGPICAQAQATRARKKSEADKAKQDRQATRARLSAMETIPQLLKKAQAAFNLFIRMRDKDRPCICCGQPLSSFSSLTGGEFDAGHYRSVGSAPHVRFNEDNVHGQKKSCNQWGAGRAVDYRIGLIKRIGIDRVEALENNNAIHKWTHDELRAIAEKYRKKARELKNQAEK